MPINTQNPASSSPNKALTLIEHATCQSATNPLLLQRSYQSAHRIPLASSDFDGANANQQPKPYLLPLRNLERAYRKLSIISDF